jgi:SAM-dependent methyltransferase
VLGFDISERMLQRARDAWHDDHIEYERADLEDVELGGASVDLVYSSLAFHYVRNLPELVARIRTALVPGGRLVCSVEHPIITASQQPEWVRRAEGGPAWPVDHYFDEGPRSTKWLVEGVVKQHRMLGTYFSILRRTGFVVSHLEDWGPTQEQVAARPEWATERERPLFLIVSAIRP